ncbi:HNH endonuclease [Afipia felis]|uniref:HNH endonuclease n=2 Tax=Afipia felis TaxID=1035 RepID=A0A380WAY2_AFIFE|nr:hypothetical protein HMPREF9697_01817 [Afipia felis ATCC 53690]SUU77997.1 HNH endonuclease [Afipia felis]SUU86062.1 HNH endonuclease [Afipia felis]
MSADKDGHGPLKNARGLKWGMLPTTAAEARELGVDRYFTGVECVNGHLSPHYTVSRFCVECRSETNGKFRAENPSYHRGKKAEFRANNPGVHAARARDYRRRRGDKVRETEAKYRKQNPLRKIAKDARRRAREKAGTYTADELNDILKSQKYRCVYCSTSIRAHSKRHLDHVIPLAKGGVNDKSNLQFLCVACNLSKSDKMPEVFARSKGLLI